MTPGEVSRARKEKAVDLLARGKTTREVAAILGGKQEAYSSLLHLAARRKRHLEVQAGKWAGASPVKRITVPQRGAEVMRRERAKAKERGTVVAWPEALARLEASGDRKAAEWIRRQLERARRSEENYRLRHIEERRQLRATEEEKEKQRIRNRRWKRRKLEARLAETLLSCVECGKTFRPPPPKPGGHPPSLCSDPCRKRRKTRQDAEAKRRYLARKRAEREQLS